MPPSVKLNPGETFSNADQSFFKSNPKIYFGNDEPKVEAPDVDSVLNNLRLQVQGKLFELLKDNAKADGTVKNVNVEVTISDTPYLKAPSGNIVLKKALFTGYVKWVETQKPTYYKVLKKLGEEKPYAGCVVAELGTWGLVGLIVSKDNRNLRLMHVPISDRNKSKIFKQRIH